MKTAEREIRDLLNEAPKFFSHHEFDGEKLEWIQRMNAALAQPPAPEQQAPQGWKLAKKSARELAQELYDQHPTYQGTRPLTWRDAPKEVQREWIDKASDMLAASPAAPEKEVPQPVGYYRPNIGIMTAQIVCGPAGYAAPEAAKPETERAAVSDKTPPFANCRYQLCDLPGQCRGEGKCHHPKALLAADSKAGGEPLTDSYVQVVPDKCDRIVWRNHYYHLPIYQADTRPQQQAEPLTVPFDVEFAASYLDGVMEVEQPEIQSKWTKVRAFLNGIGKDQA